MASRRSFIFKFSFVVKMNSVGSKRRGKLIRSSRSTKKTSLKNALAVGADFVTLLGFISSQYFRDAILMAVVSIASIGKKIF
jgi:hypothetical protein